MANYDITKLDSAVQLDSARLNNTSISKVPTKDWFICSWTQDTAKFYAQVVSVNTTTGALTKVGTACDYQSDTASYNSEGTSIVAINATNAIVAYSLSSQDGGLRLLTIDGSGNVSTNGTGLEYDTSLSVDPSMILIDSTHVLLVWAGGASADSMAQVFSFNTGAGTITAVGSALSFDGNLGRRPSVKQLDSTHFIVTYQGLDADIYGIVLQMDGSYNMSAAGSTFEIKDGVTSLANSVCVISTSGNPYRFAALYYNDGAGVYIRTFSINTSTWAITAFGSEVTISTTGITATAQGGETGLYLLDNTHLFAAFTGESSDGFAKVYTYDSGTGALTETSSLEFDTTLADRVTAGYFGNTTDPWYATMWQSTYDGEGRIQILQVALTAGPAGVKTWNGLAIASVKTIDGLAIGSIKKVKGLG